MSTDTPTAAAVREEDPSAGSSRAVRLRDRIRENPRPFLLWLAVLAVLVALEAGALFGFVFGLVGSAVGVVGIGDPLLGAIQAVEGFFLELPTLLSRETIPNQGHMTGPNGPWEGTFLGLEPMVAWLIRLLLIYVYAAVFVWWLARGYLVYRRHYRYADWTPFDDVIDRFRDHSWGTFGAVVVLLFVVMAVFAPALGPTTAEVDVQNPFSYETQYFDEDSGEVETIVVGQANRDARSTGAGDYNTGLWQYDAYDRFHPFGTMDRGQDLFTFMMYGARVSLFIGLLTIGIIAVIATVAALVSAYYKGTIDLVTVTIGDGLQAIPLLLLLIMVNAVFDGHWLEDIYNGGFLIAVAYAAFGWPNLWRAVRGPAFQVSTEEWIDAARSYGQRPRVIMRKHMLPYVAGYLLVYASMTLGGVIIITAALSFLGIGVDAPTPEWGRAVDLGQPYIATQSWHIAMIPGIMVVLVVTAFNALGDGIRDAIDPQSEGAADGAATAAGGGG